MVAFLGFADMVVSLLFAYVVVLCWFAYMLVFLSFAHMLVFLGLLQSWFFSPGLFILCFSGWFAYYKFFSLVCLYGGLSLV